MRAVRGTMNRFVNSGRRLALGGVVLTLAVMNSAPARISAASAPDVFISEVHPSGSGNSTYKADWFEVTNTGTSAVDITGWKMDDNSNAFATAVPLSGVTSISPGQSVVFIDSYGPRRHRRVLRRRGSAATCPSGLAIGTYGGSGVGLSTSGDAVNLFDASGNRITGVSFGSANAAATFDNTAGLAADAPLPTIRPSVAGVNGAFLSANGLETGSPGRRVELVSDLRGGPLRLRASRPIRSARTDPDHSAAKQPAGPGSLRSHLRLGHRHAVRRRRRQHVGRPGDQDRATDRFDDAGARRQSPGHGVLRHRRPHLRRQRQVRDGRGARPSGRPVHLRRRAPR